MLGITVAVLQVRRKKLKIERVLGIIFTNSCEVVTPAVSILGVLSHAFPIEKQTAPLIDLIDARALQAQFSRGGYFMLEPFG